MTGTKDDDGTHGLPRHMEDIIFACGASRKRIVVADSQRTTTTDFVSQPRNLCEKRHGDKSSLGVARVDDGGPPYNNDDGEQPSHGRHNLCV